VASFVLRSSTWNHNIFRPWQLVVFHWQLVFWINAKLSGHYPCFEFIITYRLGCQQEKLYVLSRLLYITFKEGDAIYEQQCDVIFEFEHLQLQALSIIPDDNPSLSNSWIFKKWLSCYWHPKPIKKSSSSLRFFQWSCQVLVSTWFAILWWSFLCS
jgi:hypothetical protein